MVKWYLVFNSSDKGHNVNIKIIQTKIQHEINKTETESGGCVLAYLIKAANI